MFFYRLWFMAILNLQVTTFLSFCGVGNYSVLATICRLTYHSKINIMTQAHICTYAHKKNPLLIFKTSPNPSLLLISFLFWGNITRSWLHEQNYHCQGSTFFLFYLLPTVGSFPLGKPTASVELKFLCH